MASESRLLMEIGVTTASRARQAANRLAFVNIVRASSIIVAVRIAIRTDYRSFEESKAIQDAIISSIDYLLTKLGDESASDPYSDYGIYVDNRNVYSMLENLRSVFINSMRLNLLNLANEIEMEIPPDGLTSLQIVYEQYEDLNRDEGIFKRNQPTKINHPGFIGKNIKILLT